MEDHASKLKGFGWLILSCALGCGIGFGLTPLAHAIPWSWEKKIGESRWLNVAPAVCAAAKPAARDALQILVRRLYPLGADDRAISIDVDVVASPEVNAFATLGGHIYLNSGLLEKAQSPEEAAGVLAHEIGHVRLRHIMERSLQHFFTSQGIGIIFGGDSSAGQWTGYFLDMDFTRAQEKQADQAGLERLQAAHIDNQGFRHFFERMEKTEPSSILLSDHPSNAARIAMVSQFPNDHPTAIMTDEQWQSLKNYCRK